MQVDNAACSAVEQKQRHDHNAPINGMPHLVYLGRMFGKGGGVAIGT